MRIKIDHIEKTEGHSSFEGALYDGKIKEAKVLSIEGARLIEGILLDRPYEDAPIITARICGVCPVVHNVCAIRALEFALGVRVSDSVNLIRKIMILGEFLTSHLTHSYFFSLPDLLGYPNDLDMMKRYPRETKAAMRVLTFGSRLMESLGGRGVHPIASEVGGFKVWPEKEEITKLLEEQKRALEAIWDVIPLFQKSKYPILERETEFISLGDKNEYAILNGDIVSTAGHRITVAKFSRSIKELHRQTEVVKKVNFQGKTYFVGALSRINNNFDKLHPQAKKLWRQENKEKITYNSFMNIFAQVAEMLNCILVSKKLLEELLSRNPVPRQKSKIKGGTGIAAVEAPRGTLLHYYKLSQDGRIIDSNIITPTAQFLANIEEDLKVYIPTFKGLSLKKKKAKIKALIRAYDPCISCATQ